MPLREYPRPTAGNGEQHFRDSTPPDSSALISVSPILRLNLRRWRFNLSFSDISKESGQPVSAASYDEIRHAAPIARLRSVKIQCRCLFYYGKREIQQSPDSTCPNNGMNTFPANVKVVWFILWSGRNTNLCSRTGITGKDLAPRVPIDNLPLHFLLLRQQRTYQYRCMAFSNT